MVAELLGWVRLPSPLLSIDLAYGNGSDYCGGEKETFLRVWLWDDEYRSMLDVIFS